MFTVSLYQRVLFKVSQRCPSVILTPFHNDSNEIFGIKNCYRNSAESDMGYTKEQVRHCTVLTYYRIAGIFWRGRGVKFSGMLKFVVIRGKKT